MTLKIFFTLFFSVISQVIFSQIKIGEWQDYLSYNTTNSVSKVGNIVYVSNQQGLAKFNESDNSVEKLTKIDFFPQLEDAVEDKLEQEINYKAWAFDSK